MSMAQRKSRVSGGGGAPAIHRSTSADVQRSLCARHSTPPDKCAARRIVRMTDVSDIVYYALRTQMAETDCQYHA